jgi:tetratricopeptide (TPR) repeat protein
VRAFLAEEQHASVLFEGWSSLYATAARIAKTEDVRKQALECAREAWKRCPSERTADFGREIAESFLAFASQLSEDERAFALDVAAKASAAAPRSVDHLETLAAWLELAGRKADAIAALERATAIEPMRASLRSHLEQLRR